MVRKISVFTPLTAVGIQKKSEIRLDAVFYWYTAVFGPTRSTWVMTMDSTATATFDE
ncbi:hypothetical protein I4U23_021375 [Adineta vaga]|nr:hypothetical protein I4U23_021375 [Adineta vaga]